MTRWYPRSRRLEASTALESRLLTPAFQPRTVANALRIAHALQVLHRSRREQLVRLDRALRQALLDRPSQHAVDGVLVGCVAIRPDVRPHDLFRAGDIGRQPRQAGPADADVFDLLERNLFRATEGFEHARPKPRMLLHQRPADADEMHDREQPGPP